MVSLMAYQAISDYLQHSTRAKHSLKLKISELLGVSKGKMQLQQIYGTNLHLPEWCKLRPEWPVMHQQHLYLSYCQTLPVQDTG